MKLKISLSTKFAIFAAIAIISLTATVTHSNYLDQKDYFEMKLERQIEFYGQVLNAYISDETTLKNNTETTKAIDRLMEDNPEVANVNILLIDNGTYLIIN